jgi:processing peptidase subunit alpha
VLRPSRNLPQPSLVLSVPPSSPILVSTQETYGQVAAAALFIDAGAMYERDDSIGACHFLETLAFKGGEGQRGEVLSSRALASGLTLTSVFNREVIMYKVEGLRGSMEEAFEMLAEVVTTRSFSDERIGEAREAIAFQRDEALSSPQAQVSEHLYTAAYGRDTALGRPEKCPEASVTSMRGEVLSKYMEKLFTAPRMVLSVVGMQHDAALGAVNKYFKDIPNGHPGVQYNRPVCPYIGGDVRSSPDWAAMPATAAAATAKTEFTHMMLAFPTVGWSDDDVVPVCVVDTLLGGGSSFSAGGPGKGLYSRLYREVLNGHPWVEAANAFSTQLYDSGLVGVYGASEPHNAGGLINLLAGHLARLTTQPVDTVDLARARNQLASSVMMNLETRGLLCEDIGRQLLCHGKRMDPTELLRRIQSVSTDDVMRVMRHALSHPPSFAAVGDLSTVPQYAAIRHYFEEVSARFNATTPLASFVRMTAKQATTSAATHK